MRVDSNTVDVFWTLGGVLAWVMFRDLKYAQEFSEEGNSAAVLGVLGALPRMHGEEKTRPIMSFARAHPEVLIELQKGDFKSTGMRYQSPIREDILSLEWVNNTFAFMPDVARVSREFSVRFQPSWEHLRFRASYVLKLWPSKYAPALVTPTVDSQHIFVRHGKKWFLSYEGNSAWVDDSIGMTYLQHLLRNPGEEIWAIGLSQLSSGSDGKFMSYDSDGTAESSFDDVRTTPDSAMAILDKSAIAAIRQEYAKLKEDLSRADFFGNVEEIAVAEEKLLEHHQAFNKETNHKGQSRLFTSSSENARTSVTKALTRAKDAIRQELPSFYEHLKLYITTGHKNIYSPVKKLNWIFLLEKHKKN